MGFKPGEGGRPKGSKNKSTRKADEAFELVFDAMQSDDTTSLLAWAKQNPTEFFKLFAKKLTTNAESTAHVVTESLSLEQARLMAEEYIESASNSSVGEGESSLVHDSVSAGLPGGEDPPADREGATEN